MPPEAERLAGVTLVLGGARSGKSAFAERLVEESGLSPVYLATGQAFDGEMESRIALHRNRRSPQWRTVEEPLALRDALLRECAPGRAVLVDCLTLWVTNLMMAERDIAGECAALVAALPQLAGPAVFVSNEVGLGIVPDNAMARAFRDHAGRVNQAVAAAAQDVFFIAAGLPLALKTAGVARSLK
jgi:adenosylcobinamide kinase/adenosylcobinamide-phosphate guanylyltransferase